MKKKSIVILLMAATTSCITNTSRFSARPHKKAYITTPFLSEGVYVGFYKGLYGNDYGISYFIFYKNGVVLHYKYFANINERIKNNRDSLIRFLNGDITNHKQANDLETGGYVINDRVITIQTYRYVPGYKWELFNTEGKIMNDSTIHITSCFAKNNTRYCREDYDLDFIPMLQPDSTNRLMKKNWYWAKE